MNASLLSIASRKKQEMQWQLILVSLSQPVFSEDAADEKSNIMSEIWGILQQGESQEEAPREPLNDVDKLALLKMAGHMPVRIIEDGSS